MNDHEFFTDICSESTVKFFKISEQSLRSRAGGGAGGGVAYMDNQIIVHKVKDF